METLKRSRKGQVCSSILEKTYDLVTLYIPYRDNLISLDSIVVDDLPEYNKGFSMTATLSDLKKRKIKLADKKFNLPLEEQSSIELLIGVMIMYIIFCTQGLKGLEH